MSRLAHKVAIPLDSIARALAPSPLPEQEREQFALGQRLCPAREQPLARPVVRRQIAAIRVVTPRR